MLRVMMFRPNFISKKMFLAVLVIATSVGSVAFAQRTMVVDAKGTLTTTGNIVTESATAPTTPAPIQGDVWFDITNNLVKVWEGSVWKTVSTPGETNTSLTQDTTTGVITYTAEDGLDDTANVVSTAADNLLSVGADGGAFLNQSIAGGVSAGYRVWEFSSGVEDTYMYNDLGFLTSIWNAIPFNSTPVLVNSTGNPQEFTFNADGSIGLEAGHVYRISVSLGLHKPGDSGLRLVEQGNSSNVLATSIDEYTFYYDTVAVRMEAIISPTTTANYNVEFYYTNSGTIIRTAQTRYNQIIPRATFQLEVLN